ncbi:type I restriction endonuclease subunit R [Crenobacter cavernae]|uniref:Type I restriction endonuclease subunit R n=1 Tax=Crenobacter cavernae TaxID=2290923 RepID=A0ABY0FHM2_9NEIS|nr:type I restriction endonuclease subunit R [Crenobacter cavernae]RXZ44802.1 type I restriction endonuclease subunit R [Crenobacter cavernae]
MDGEPFLTVDFEQPVDESLSQLYRFRFDQFKPDTVRSIAEESVYLAALKAALGACLRDIDADFVRFLATRANIQRTFTTKFLDGLAPIARKAVELTISDMVVSGLSVKPAGPTMEIAPIPIASAPAEPSRDVINPDNDRIVTTAIEKQLFSVCQTALGDEVDIQPKDTESYFSILYQGKTNRWLLRYWGDKKRPVAEFGFDLSEQHRQVLEHAGLELAKGNAVYLPTPLDLLRAAGTLRDALAFCSDDRNFAKPRKEETSA